MRGLFSWLMDFFTADPDETKPHRFWRQLVLALLPPVSMLVSIVILVLLFPHHENHLLLIIGLMLLLLVHELGHLFILKLKGIPASGPYFIPLLGAFVMMTRPNKGEDIAQVALAGPFFGGLGALFCLFIAIAVGAQSCTDWTLAQGIETLVPRYCYVAGAGPQWLLLAQIGFLFNLINLVPLLPFDGGQATGIASRWLWLLGIPIGVAFLFTSLQLASPVGNLVSLIIVGTLLFSGIATVYALWKPRQKTTPVRMIKRVQILVLYLLLCGGLFWGNSLVTMLLTIVREGINFPINP